MKNVCFLNSVKFWGGGEKLHLEYALQLRSFGHKVYLACDSQSSLHLAAHDNNIPTYSCALSGISFLNPLRLLALRRFLIANDIDTVLFSISRDAKFAALAARFAGIDRIVYLRGLAKPISNSRLNRFLLLKLVSHVVANSEETRKLAISGFDDPAIEAKTSVVYHGIDLGEFDRKLSAAKNSAAESTSNAAFIIATAGRLEEQKGHWYLIEAARQLKDEGRNIKVLIAGAGSKRLRLQTQINAAGLEDIVILCGFSEDIERFLLPIDLFVLPSLWEGFGYSIVEAMAASKPVVAFRLSSNPEIIEHQKTGILVSQKEDDALSTAIGQMIDHPNLRRRLGKSGRKRVEDRFQLADAVAELRRQIS